MPLIKSAKKALRQNKKRRIRNIRKKKTIKQLFKKLNVLISQKKTQEAQKLLPRYYKALDKAAKTNILKKNKASREKSQITKLINKKE